MKKIYFKSVKTHKFVQLSEPKRGSWIDIYEAEADEIREISKYLNLNYEDLRDSLDIYEVPRIEKVDDKVIIFIRYPSDDISELFTQTLCIVVTSELIITISKHHNKLLKRIRKFEKDFNSTQSSKFFMKILHEIARDFTAQISAVAREVSMRSKVLSKVNDKDIEALIRFEKSLNQFLSTLLPTKSVLDTLINSEYIHIYNNDMSLLHDLIISINQSIDLCRVNLKSIQSLRDSHQIYFTNKLSRTIQILTVVTIIMAVPTIISSIFGMNVNLPLQDHPAGFVIIILISVLFSFITFVILKVKGWV